MPKQQTGARLKIIVRRLPPHLPEDVFWQSVEQWVTDQTVSWRKFCPGKLRVRDRLNKEDIPSRAYIQFNNAEQIAIFSKEYDGHVFRDKQGKESYAVVEFAPFQKIPPPKERGKVDSRVGTIEKDEDYKSFIQSLTEPPAPYQTPAPPNEPPKLTPLLEALIAEKTILKAKHGLESAKQSGAKESRGGRSVKGAQTSQASPAVDNVSNRPKAETEPHPKGKRSGKGKKDAAPTTENNHLRQKNASGHPGGGPPKTGPHVVKNPAPKPPQIPNGPQISESKPPRREREKERKKAREATTAANAPAVTVLANPQAQNQRSTAAPAHSKKSETAASTTPTPAASASTAAPAEPSRPRRGRPMLGLGSRQFAAALSHAGVSGSGKPPREKGSGGGQDSNAAT